MSSVYRKIKGGITAPQGFVSSAVSAGVKNPADDRLDMALIVSLVDCVAAGKFTTNRVKAAPVKVSQTHLRDGNVRAILVNSGNANACTGIQGLQDARKCTRLVGKLLGIKQSQVAVCSTGVIGLPMPMLRIEPKLDDLVTSLKRKEGTAAAQAIMTSDTYHKEISVSLVIGGVKIKIGACAKGAGMINPHMATMLCFVTTDAKLPKDALSAFVSQSVDVSFNRITIDGDMSTNDSVIMLANGASGGKSIRRGTSAAKKFQEALNYVMLEMAKSLVRDGERVTKFVTVNVKGAKSYNDAKKVAEAVANSSLVKCSWNGNDPNWGRIIHAVGYSKAMVKEEFIDIHIGGLAACLGGIEANVSMDALRKKVAADAFTIEINLNLCGGEYTIYSSDLSPEYVDFNRSEYAYWKQARKDGLTKQ
ncbi:MAG: glutamate N-acetyltransferase/amino-acid N-acetyltransferase [Rubritalea sp.]|jgi:glutamate N-acetyltransferase/amino-acid N-acetyltransferase